MHQVLGDIYIPPAVAAELSRMTSPVRFDPAGWPRIHIVPLQQDTLARELSIRLDPGEAEAIALAEELHASLLLIDEAKGRRIAIERGIPVTGLLGVLLAAKAGGHIPAVAPLLHALIHDAHFRIGEALQQHVLQLAGERS
ncbi:MAG: DUF3368 domain-containing protein [Bacteroidia bacterium]|nr:DUF3368 domain-containing protein [Bacteroidia bacterium]